MDNNINDIDQFFKDNLDGHSSSYLPGAWESMEAMLDDGTKGFWAENVYRYVLTSVVATIVLAGSVAAYISGYNSRTSAFAQKPAQTTETPAADANSATGNTETTGTETLIADAQTNNAISTAPTESKSVKPKVKQTKANNTNNTTAPNKNSNAGGNDGNSKVTAPETDNSTVPEKPLLAVTETEQPAIETAEIEVAPTTTLETSTFDKQNYLPGLLAVRIFDVNSLPIENNSLTIEPENGYNQVKLSQATQQRLAEEGRHFRWEFGLTAGANFNKVLSNTGASGWGSGLTAGIYASKNFSKWKPFGIGFGMNYLRSNSNSIGRTITQTSYFFEKTTTSYFLVTKSLDYVQAPISLTYNATHRHSFGLGLVASMLVNAQTEVAQNMKNSRETISSTNIEKGVYEDLRRFGYGFTAAYEFKIPGVYSIGLRYNQQLSDLTLNSYFNDDKKHLPANVQLYLKLNLNR